MINILPILLFIGIGIILLLLSIGIKIYSKKIGTLYKDHQVDFKRYRRDLSIGLTSAMIVVVMDKIVTLFTNGLPNLHLDISSPLSFFASGVGIIIVFIFISLFLLFSVLFLIYSGFPKKK